MITNFKLYSDETSDYVISETAKNSIKKVIKLAKQLPPIRNIINSHYHNEEVPWEVFFTWYSKKGTKGAAKEVINKISKILEMSDFWCDKQSVKANNINKILDEIRDEYNKIILPELKEVLKKKEINEGRGVNNHTKNMVEKNHK
jgi:hypothetical protein